MVEDIESFHSQLEVQRVRETGEANIFDERKINIDQARAYELVAPLIPLSIQTEHLPVCRRRSALVAKRRDRRARRDGWKHEAVGVDVIQTIALEVAVDWIAVCDHVGECAEARSMLPKDVSSLQQSEGNTCASNHAALLGVPEVISLKSDWFLNGKQIPLRFAGMGGGENISPPLSWSGVPEETVELAIIMEDSDAPLAWPFVHMIAYRIAADQIGFAEGALASGARGMAFGKSTAGAQGYMGPRPIPGHGPHRYIFQILALSRRTAFSSAPKIKVFLDGISRTVIGRGMLVGIYKRL
jgi:Raf kinase inhibitor-like YbhB/YbcL family protein